MLIESPRMPPTLLPLEEAEPVKVAPPRKRHWWQHKPTDAEVLRYAVHVLDERGWAKGEWIGEGGSVCLLGAIGVAAIESGRKTSVDRLKDVSFTTRADVASRNIVGHRQAHSLWQWNDGVAQDVSHVKKVLASLARQAEANGGKYRPGRSF